MILRRSVVLALLALGCRPADPAALVGPPSDGCGATLGAGVRASDSAGLQTWAVLPVSTDRCITQRLDSHMVHRAGGVAAKGRLFVFLPGTGGVAGDYRLIGAQAARSGYHALGISYPNETAVASLCNARAASCYGDTRLEVLTGRESSPAVTVDRANSIENRIIRLLQFMHGTDPAGNWNQFLVNDTTVRWGTVSVAGHSRGGGDALFIAQRYEVFRATTYASFGDALPGGQTIAPWVTRSYATPMSRVFGLISSLDEVTSPLSALAVWTTIGMGTMLVDVDITAMPYGSTQRFITAASPINSRFSQSPNHHVVALDFNTPRFNSVTPIFAGVWRALSFPP